MAGAKRSVPRYVPGHGKAFAPATLFTSSNLPLNEREDAMPVVHTPQSRLRFGVARRDITPPVGIYHRMWGAASHDRSTGVHRPLTATALVFQDANAEVPVLSHPAPPLPR